MDNLGTNQRNVNSLQANNGYAIAERYQCASYVAFSSYSMIGFDHAFNAAIIAAVFAEHFPFAVPISNHKKPRKCLLQ